PVVGLCGLGSARLPRWMGGCEIPLTDPYAVPLASNALTLTITPVPGSGFDLRGRERERCAAALEAGLTRWGGPGAGSTAGGGTRGGLTRGGGTGGEGGRARPPVPPAGGGRGPRRRRGSKATGLRLRAPAVGRVVPARLDLPVLP